MKLDPTKISRYMVVNIIVSDPAQIVSSVTHGEGGSEDSCHVLSSLQEFIIIV